MTRDIFSRWSERRRRVADEEAAERADEAAKAAPDAPDEDASGETEAELLRRLDLKPPEDLEQGDDFAAYMRAAVPEAIRRRALRQLWRSNPVLACLDGLNDYDDDFTGDTVPAGQLRTAYKVGRGLLDQFAPEAQATAEAAGEEEPAETEATTESVAESAPPETPEPDPSPEAAAPVRRRMVFRPESARRKS